MIRRLCAAAATCATLHASAQTFCNPLNLPYHFQAPGPVRREAADPVIVLYQDKYWLFASKQIGYWWSDDLLSWRQVLPTGLPLSEYAPSITVVNGRLVYMSSGNKGAFTTADPVAGRWTPIGPYKPGAADPELFQDTDGKVYLYDGCSDKTPLRVTRLDPVTLQPLGEFRNVIAYDTLHHGWENEPSAPGRAPWIEGSWMNKLNGRYYWQYSAPGTQYASYADGVYVSDHPEGPFAYQPYSPFSFKPTGFITGAGHSSTFADKTGNLWHIATGTISVRHMFERRLVLFPAAVLPDGQLTVDTYLGDYPQWAPGRDTPVGGAPANGGSPGAAEGSNRPRWMLLSYKKPATSSSTLNDTFAVSNAFDENIRTWWSAATPRPNEWVEVDLQKTCTVNAIQVNFADQGIDADSLAGGDVLQPGDGYAYIIEGSRDHRKWAPLVSRRTNRDTPHDYTQLGAPAPVRYIRITSLHNPAGSLFSLYDLRVFGNAAGPAPAQVRNLTVNRDGRNAHLEWEPTDGAQFYIVRYGIKPDRLYGNYQVYDGHSLDIHALNTETPYYFTVDAVNEAGVTKGVRPQ